MLFCKLCNTRIGPRDRTCQNCGSAINRNTPLGILSSAVDVLPAPELSTARDYDETLPDHEDVPAVDAVEIEVELDEVTSEFPGPAAAPHVEPENTRGSAGTMDEQPAAPAPETAIPSPRTPPSEAKNTVETTRTRVQSSKPPAAAAPAPKPEVPSMPDPSGLRALLAEHPDALEGGLCIWRSDDGKTSGVGLESEVGRIDLLALDAQGNPVVVLIADGSSGDQLVAGALTRIGWVRKHRAKPGQRVRGIVLCASAPADLSYAAAAVADTVGFKTYRMAIAFDDIEV